MGELGDVRPCCLGRRPLPRLLQVSWSGSAFSGARPPSLHVPILQTHLPPGVWHAGCSLALPRVTPPNNGEGDRSRRAHPLSRSLCSPCSEVLLVRPPRAPAPAREVLHPSGPPHGPQAAGGEGGRCGGAAQGRGAGPGTMRWRRGRASRVADSGCSAPRPCRAPSPSAAGRTPTRGGWLAAAGPAGRGLAEGRTRRRLHKGGGVRRRAGRRQGGPRPDRQVWALGARGCRGGRPQPGSLPDAPGPPGDTEAAAASW